MNKELDILFLFEYRKEMLFHLSQKPYNDQHHSFLFTFSNSLLKSLSNPEFNGVTNIKQAFNHIT